MPGGRQPVTGPGLAIGDRLTDQRGDLLVQQRRVVAVDLDIEHCASNSSSFGYLKASVASRNRRKIERRGVTSCAWDEDAPRGCGQEGCRCEQPRANELTSAGSRCSSCARCSATASIATPTSCAQSASGSARSCASEDRRDRAP